MIDPDNPPAHVTAFRDQVDAHSGAVAKRLQGMVDADPRAHTIDPYAPNPILAPLLAQQVEIMGANRGEPVTCRHLDTPPDDAIAITHLRPPHIARIYCIDCTNTHGASDPSGQCDACHEPMEVDDITTLFCLMPATVAVGADSQPRLAASPILAIAYVCATCAARALAPGG